MIAPIRRDNVAAGFALSIVFHAIVIGAFYVTLPMWKKDTVIEPPLIVELVPIDEITAAPPQPAPKAEEKPPEPEAQPEPPKPEEATPEPEDKPEPEPEPPPPEPTPEPKVPPPKVQPPPPKPEPPKPKKDVSALQQLMKDIQKKTPQKPQEQAPAAAPSTEKSSNQTAAISDRATMTELDAIRHHFEGCWRIDPGMEGIEELSAEIRVYIGIDGSVQRADIVDTVRYFADSKFRTFVNNARIAVLGCSGVPITANNYEQLKVMTLNFSPQGRIN